MVNMEGVGLGREGSLKLGIWIRWDIEGSLGFGEFVGIWVRRDMHGSLEYRRFFEMEGVRCDRRRIDVEKIRWDEKS